MGASGEVCDQLAVKFEVLLPHLDERQRRLLMGAEARILGHGGIRAVARTAEVSEATVRKGVAELEADEDPLGRVRRSGGGRKKAVDLDPGLRPALLALVEPDERGDPMSPLRWTVKSTRNLAAELTRPREARTGELKHLGQERRGRLRRGFRGTAPTIHVVPSTASNVRQRLSTPMAGDLDAPVRMRSDAEPAPARSDRHRRSGRRRRRGGVPLCL